MPCATRAKPAPAGEFTPLLFLPSGMMNIPLPDGTDSVFSQEFPQILTSKRGRMSLVRRKTRKVIVGDKQHGFVGIGGDAPVALQTMTSTYTYDIDVTVKQINALHRGGADMVRVAVPDRRDTIAA